MSQFTSASLHRVDPGSRPDIAERNPQGRSGRAPGVVDFGAILDRMAPRPPEPAEAPDRVDDPAAASRSAPDRDIRRAREHLSPARNERQHPQHEARAPRRDDRDASEAATAPVDDMRGIDDAAAGDAPGAGADSAAHGPRIDEAAPDERDTPAPATEASGQRAEATTTGDPEESGGSRDEAGEQAGFTLEPASNPERTAAPADIGIDPAAATLLALGLPAQQVQAGPTASILPAADFPATIATGAAPLASPAAMPAAMAAAVPAAPTANGPAAGGASDPAFGTMLQAQAAAQPREVQAAPQQPRFPEATQSAPAAEVAPATAVATMTSAPTMAQAQAMASQAVDAGAVATATQPGPAAAAPASAATTNPQVQIAVATPAVAAAIAQGTTRADAQSTPINPAQSFAIELEAPTTEGTPHAQPSNSTPTAARPQPAAPAPVAAQLVAQGQAVDATAQAQATAPTGPAAASLAKANSDAPALAVAEAGAFAARKDAPDGALAAQPAAQPARAEATPEAAAARGARVPAHPAVAQVAVSVAKAAQDGVERITIKLQPPELGRIDVKIEVGVDGRIQAVFAAERAATVDILQREVRELERALQGAGLDAGGGLSFGLKQNGGNGGHGAYAGLERGQGGSGRGAPEDDSRQQQQPRRMATADGRVDIHV